MDFYDNYNPPSDDSSSSSDPEEKENPTKKRTPSASGIISLTVKRCRVEQHAMEIASADEEQEVPSPPPKKKKWSRAEKDRRKQLRNSGQEYITGTGKTVRKRERKPVHDCVKRRCQDFLSDEVADLIFQEYWDPESRDKRVAYVASRVECLSIKQKRPKLPEGHDRQHSKSVVYKYYFDVGGEPKQVCKSTFLNTLDETDMFLRLAVENKRRALSGVTQPDRRERRPPRNKLAEETENAVKTHILSYPSYESHYKRDRTGDTRFLPTNLTVKLMHIQYLGIESNPRVSYATYRKIFVAIGRKFKPPKTDSGGKCDGWEIRLPELEGEEKEEQQRLWDEHLERAEQAYQLKREEKAKAKSDPTRRVLVFDLERCLETPFLKANVVVYSRQLYTFNLTITDTTTCKTYCSMWHEAEGGRGANQIASCVFRHIIAEIPDIVECLYLFSDSCSGQNRNSHVGAMLFAALQEHPGLQKIVHVFLETGHTRLECDSRHSVVERLKLLVPRFTKKS